MGGSPSMKSMLTSTPFSEDDLDIINEETFESLGEIMMNHN